VNNTITRCMRTVLEEHNLPVGTSLENKVTWRLHRWNALDQCQYRVGPYRLDYAWPSALIALEVDGPHHWRPDVAVKDVARDSYLRARGWLVFRVDDTSDTLEEQLCRVVRVVRSDSDYVKLAELDGGGDHAA
jgi:very-short-patch-repair endonuclease